MNIEYELAEIKTYYSTHLTFIIETVISSMYFWGYNVTTMGDGKIKAIFDKGRNPFLPEPKQEIPKGDMFTQLNYQINQKPDTIKNYLLKMGLISYFSLFEAFNKDFFQKIFIFKPEIMKNKNKEVNLDFVLKFDKIEELHKALSQKEIEKIGRFNIDEIASFLFNKFKIDLKSNLECWLSLRESYYRRNIIVHKNGKISEIYIQKLSLGRDHLDKELICDIEYITNCYNYLQEYINYISNSIRKKFKLKSSLDSI